MEKILGEDAQASECGTESPSEETDDDGPPGHPGLPRRGLARALAAMDSLDLEVEARRKVIVLQGVPGFMRGHVRNAFRVALAYEATLRWDDYQEMTLGDFIVTNDFVRVFLIETKTDSLKSG